MTAFFVPGVGAGQAETRYAELAEVAGAAAGSPEERFASIRFVHGAEQWTRRPPRRRRRRLDQVERFA